jgi:hypothetical protein
MSSGWERSGEKAAWLVRVDLADPHYLRRCHACDVTDHDAAGRHRIINPQHGGLVPPRTLDSDELSVEHHPDRGILRAEPYLGTSVRIAAPRCQEP